MGVCRHSVTSGSDRGASLTIPEKIIHEAGALLDHPHSLCLFRTPPYEPPRLATFLCAVCASALYPCLRLVLLRHLHASSLSDTTQPRCADLPHNTISGSTGTMAVSLVCYPGLANDCLPSWRLSPTSVMYVFVYLTLRSVSLITDLKD